MQQTEDSRIALGLAQHVVRQNTQKLSIGRFLRDLLQNKKATPGPARGKIAIRDLQPNSGSAGGYLKGTQTSAVVDLLRDGHFLRDVGAQFVEGLAEDVAIPVIKAGIAGQWLAGSSAAITPSEPVLGQVSMSPKRAAGLVEYSRLLHLQAEACDAVISTQLTEAITSMLEQAVIAGAGASQPLGVINTAGVNSQAGASLSYAGLRAMRKAILLAGAAERNLKWIGSPDVQETLGGRSRETGSGRFLWDDAGILGRPAIATAFAPAGVLVCGDWSRCTIGIWNDTVEVEVDPFYNFATGGFAARLILHCDVAFTNPSAFSVATSIN